MNDKRGEEMLQGGISIKGSYHEINQDYYLSKAFDNGHIIVVSDGMGSKRLSHYGSKAICESVYDVISEYSAEIDDMDFREMLSLSHEEWKKRVEEYGIINCYATLLVVVVTDNKIKAARLGDGFLGVYLNEEVICLFDKKEGYFANETDCLRESFEEEKLETVELDYDIFRGAICCTDGIEIRTMQNEDLQNFTKGFIEEYGQKNETDIKTDVENWLKDWPGTDDKTLAFMIEEVK